MGQRDDFVHDAHFAAGRESGKDSGLTQTGLEDFVPFFSPDLLVVTDFALEAELCKPGDGVEEAEKNGRIYCEFTFESRWIKAIEQFRDVKGNQSEDGFMNSAGLVLTNEVGH